MAVLGTHVSFNRCWRERSGWNLNTLLGSSYISQMTSSELRGGCTSEPTQYVQIHIRVRNSRRTPPGKETHKEPETWFSQIFMDKNDSFVGRKIDDLEDTLCHSHKMIKYHFLTGAQWWANEQEMATKWRANEQLGGGFSRTCQLWTVAGWDYHPVNYLVQFFFDNSRWM